MTRVEAQKTMRNNINSIAQLVPLIVGQRERERERERGKEKEKEGGERKRDESGPRLIDKIATAIVVPLDICVNKIDKCACARTRTLQN